MHLADICSHLVPYISSDATHANRLPHKDPGERGYKEPVYLCRKILLWESLLTRSLTHVQDVLLTTKSWE